MISAQVCWQGSVTARIERCGSCFDWMCDGEIKASRWYRLVGGVRLFEVWQGNGGLHQSNPASIHVLAWQLRMPVLSGCYDRVLMQSLELRRACISLCCFGWAFLLA